MMWSLFFLSILAFVYICYVLMKPEKF
ncbi:K+-transporting ATPase subunit F [Chryseobacterium joostei]|uniref:K+-transporting ATPase subunit F n=8 Tax=Chryseobacterium TaxID=59732 RepID=A0ABX6KVS8_CHRGL|nr:K+-transporting ATPase subunit F [Chryseobacterium indologenes]AYZ14927.1 K+-transporting ATPase subunit F [Chryseobacterium arthrosphaerae]AZB02377.1 K+-transporting ATPase subunit F [Chryseobacterium joostei]NIF06990.1 K+-transporting ATPase subunit F [Chryseobacterium sp. Tr-659]PKF74815.1 K+-transporting ATPase subunit F [Chryseobacterium sp. PMSZPI]PWN66761.1 K+-transporting ATPase subunit F [Chryseobacterium oncorhynchi]QIY92713.1 K+-transporting ATPase subunit F [Chryseobacterium ga